MNALEVSMRRAAICLFLTAKAVESRFNADPTGPSPPNTASPQLDLMFPVQPAAENNLRQELGLPRTPPTNPVNPSTTSAKPPSAASQTAASPHTSKGDADPMTMNTMAAMDPAMRGINPLAWNQMMMGGFPMTPNGHTMPGASNMHQAPPTAAHNQQAGAKKPQQAAQKPAQMPTGLMADMLRSAPPVHLMHSAAMNPVIQQMMAAQALRMQMVQQQQAQAIALQNQKIAARRAQIHAAEQQKTLAKQAKEDMRAMATARATERSPLMPISPDLPPTKQKKKKQQKKQ